MLKKRTTAVPKWVEPFLAAMRSGKTAREAAALASTTFSNAEQRRRRNPEFARQWAECESAVDAAASRRHVATITPGTVRASGRLDRFLDELAASSNVSSAAAIAGVSPSAIYKLRREDPGFARRWFAALAEGYDNLEMELLGRLRGGEGADKDKPKFDIAAALRCLAAHRESVAREKGRRTLADEVITIASINAKIDKLRLNKERSDAAIAAARAENARRKNADTGSVH